MAHCSACGASLRDDDRFCASCGASAGAAVAGAAVAGAAVGGAALAGAGSTGGLEAGEQVLFEGNPAVIGSAGALLLTLITVGLAAVFFWIRSLGYRYRITNHRLVIEEGILSKRLEQIDLYRVTDYVVERPFGQRLLGTGNLIIQSNDRTTPTLRVEGIRTDIVALYEALRRSTEQDRVRRNVRTVDYD